MHSRSAVLSALALVVAGALTLLFTPASPATPRRAASRPSAEVAPPSTPAAAASAPALASARSATPAPGSPGTPPPLPPAPVSAVSAAPVPPPRVADLLEAAGDLSDPAVRERTVAAMRALQQERRAAAENRARELGLPLRRVLPNGRVQQVYALDPEGRPLYRTTLNLNAARSSGASQLHAEVPALTGSGVIVGVWDGGSVRTSHQEFGGRAIKKNAATDEDDHGTHVAGTIAASGVNAAARGMAPAATIHSYDWDEDYAEMTAAAATAGGQTTKIYLSNHSYGGLTGWEWIGETDYDWEWYGTGTGTSGSDSYFGQYDDAARDADAVAYGSPYLLVFRAAGNDGTDNPENGDIVRLNPDSTTNTTYNSASHPKGDGLYRGGYDNIAFDAIGKNVVTVGSTSDAVTGTQRDLAKALVSDFSSWGPTDDGRIKPDLVANGEEVYSSVATSNTAYDGEYSGTSMATPSAAGSAALLVQLYGQLFPGAALRASTLKALLLHTADDLGTAGPDYRNGWGLINVKAAADLLRDHAANPLKLHVNEARLDTAITTLTHEFIWDGVSPIRATLCWTDPAGTSTTSADSRTARLRNNLDLKITGPTGTTHLPYVMPFVGTWTQASMALPATTGVNNTDNVEQVYLANPGTPGVYRAVVTFQGTLANNAQDYGLIISGSAAEAPPPPTLALQAVSPDTGIAGETATLTLSGAALSTVTDLRLTRSGQPDLVATNLQLVGGTLRATVNLTGAASGAWTIVATGETTASLPAAFTVVTALWSANFDTTTSGWSNQPIRGTATGWTFTTASSHTANRSATAAGPGTRTTQALLSPTVAIPAGATNLALRFWHRYTLETDWDGGRLEYQINGGTWTGAGDSGSGTTFDTNGYTLTIDPDAVSDFAGKPAWSGTASSFGLTVLKLTDTARFAGQSVRFRWSLATDDSTTSTGWWVDTIALTGSESQPQPATVTLSNLAQTYDGTPRPVTVTTEPAALATSVLYNGSATPPVNAGSYAVAAQITASGYTGSANGTLVVAPAAATVTLSGLRQVYDGTAKPVQVTTNPPGIAFTLTYDGSTAPPSAFGTYTVAATITDANYAGSARGSLAITPAFATWAAAQGLTGNAALASADPDGDGLPNLVEFALGGDPLAADTAQLQPQLTAQDGVIELTFTRAPESVGMADVIVQLSSDLTTWTDFATLSDAQTGPVRLTLPGGGAAQFARLRVVPR